jgi:hypothetical protein
MVLAMDRALVPLIDGGRRHDKFGDADQIVGDQVEQEIGTNGGDAAFSIPCAIPSWRLTASRTSGADQSGTSMTI